MKKEREGGGEGGREEKWRKKQHSSQDTIVCPLVTHACEIKWPPGFQRPNVDFRVHKNTPAFLLLSNIPMH